MNGKIISALLAGLLLAFIVGGVHLSMSMAGLQATLGGLSERFDRMDERLTFLERERRSKR